MSQAQPREQLLQCYRAALAAVGGRERVRAVLRAAAPTGPLAVIAIGKAASAMLQGAADCLGERLQRALLITKEGHADPAWDDDARVAVLESAHPVPDARSLEAGQRLLRFLDDAPERLLFLISGGASSLVEVPVAGVSLEQLQALNRHLLASGLDIHRMNRARQAVSRIKGGRLARFLGGRQARVLLISDVAGDDPAVVGSGLLVPAQSGPMPELPAELAVLLQQAEPVPPRPAFANVEVELIASNGVALDAAAACGERLGLAVHRQRRFVDGDALKAAAEIAADVLEGPPGLYLWGGEPTMRLPADPGCGGRMQALALAAAEHFAGRTDVWLLAAGTDGSDGPTEDAGALIDGSTWQGAAGAGHDPRQALARADAGSALAACDGLIRTGPTGTNVMDVMLGLKLEQRQ